MPEYILDPCVEDELWGIWHFIAQDNPDAATRVVESAYKTFKTLAANPGIGRKRRFRNPKHHVRKEEVFVNPTTRQLDIRPTSLPV